MNDYDERRRIVIPGDAEKTLLFALDEWLLLARKAIQERGVFNCALSGGSTPKKLYEMLKEKKQALDWTKARLYFSDERVVPLDHPDSNFHMAWEAGFNKLVSRSQIFPMVSSLDANADAKAYNGLIENVVFDLIMLGMGDDGHTASLFPRTHALSASGELVAANFLPEKEVWRLTMTFDAINRGRHVSLYVLGKSKAEMVKNIFTKPFDLVTYPSQNIGTASNKALWILDNEAASLLE